MSHMALREVAFRYPRGEFTLDFQQLELELGEAVALVGPSGSGKSTVLQLAAGILTPQRGAVWCDGHNLAMLSERARRRWRLAEVGLIFQSFELLEHLFVLENILLPYFLGGGLRCDATVIQRARLLAERAQIARYLTRRPALLSMGERQRVAVCRALIARPRWVLADEPTASLDAATADLVLTMLLEHARQQPAALLVATHDTRLLPRFDRVVECAG